MKKKDLDRQLQSNFAAKGWRLERVAQLPAAFTQMTKVTPFFQPRVLRRSEARYLIDGYLGFIHREFERQWMSSHELKLNSHCLALNIANLDELRAKQHIGRDANWSLLEFCGAVIEILKSLPSNEDAMREAFHSGRLIGVPLEKFVIYGRTEKFSKLQVFANAGQLH